MNVVYSLIFLLFSLSVKAQTDYLAVAFRADLFDKKEIRDSQYKKVEVFIYRYNYDQPAEKADSVFIAQFDPQGKVFFEKVFADEDDSSVYVHSYDNSGNLLKSFENAYLSDGHNRYFIRRTTLYENGQMKNQDEWYGNIWGNTTVYVYNEKNKLVRTLFTSKDSFSGISHYVYDFNETLGEIKQIESIGLIKDSILYRFVHDSMGHLLEEWKKPSATYFKQLGYDCAEGLSYYHRYEYDSLGRKIFETDFKKGDSINSAGYVGRFYKKIRYNDSGFTESWYDSKDQLKEKNVYNFYKSQTFPYYYLRESYNHTTKLTTYLSENSKLPKSIEYDKSGLKITYLIKYSK